MKAEANVPAVCDGKEIVFTSHCEFCSVQAQLGKQGDGNRK